MTTVFDRITDQRQHVNLYLVDDINQALVFDAVLNEGHEGASETTDHPVEEGSDLTDHIRRQPDELEITGVVSDYPLVERASENAVGSVPGGDPRTRSRDAYFFLLDIKDKGQLVVVTTRLRQYTNMAITGLSVTRTAENARILEVDIALREINIATTETVAAPKPSSPTRNRKKNQGKKTKEEETDANKSKARRSYLRSLSGDVTQTLGVGA